MRTVRFLLGFALFCSSASGVIIQLSGDTDPACVSPLICIEPNSPFNLPVNPAGGGFFQIVNDTGASIVQLNFSLTYIDPNCLASNAPVLPTLVILPGFATSFGGSSLTTSPSASCDSNRPDLADYLLTVNILPGIPNAGMFFVSLNNDQSTKTNGAGGWLEGNTVNTAVLSSPEPATMAAPMFGPRTDLDIRAPQISQLLNQFLELGFPEASTLRSGSSAASLRE